jgi:uncharacterized membrane protein (UPF0127 family)
MGKVRVENVNRGQMPVTRGQVAGNIVTRLRGLVGDGPLEEGEGLLIVPCNSIHTHFMSFAIDVVYVERTQKVVAIDHAMKPWPLAKSVDGPGLSSSFLPGQPSTLGLRCATSYRSMEARSERPKAARVRIPCGTRTESSTRYGFETLCDSPDLAVRSPTLLTRPLASRERSPDVTLTVAGPGLLRSLSD